MKRFHSFFVALVVFAVAALPAGATLTNSNTYTPYGSVDFYPALIAATANDTTTTATSNVISNIDGSIKDLCGWVNATNQTGTSPTLTLSFLGAGAAAGPYFALKGAQGGTAGTLGTMATSALDISTASSTNVSTGLCTSQFGLGNAMLPPFLKMTIVVGGSGSPGWTGVAGLAAKHSK